MNIFWEREPDSAAADNDAPSIAPGKLTQRGTPEPAGSEQEPGDGASPWAIEDAGIAGNDGAQADVE